MRKRDLVGKFFYSPGEYREGFAKWSIVFFKFDSDYAVSEHYKRVCLTSVSLDQFFFNQPFSL